MESLQNLFLENLKKNSVLLITLFMSVSYYGFKAFLWIYSFKVFTLLRIYFHSGKFRAHQVLKDLQFFKGNYDFANSITCKGRQELIISATSLDVFFTKIFFHQLFKYVFRDNFFQFFIHNFKNLNSKNLSIFVQNEHKELRKNLPDLLRKKLSPFMTDEDFNKFIDVYLEVTEIFFILFQENLKTLEGRKNLYAVFFEILDYYRAILQTYKLTIGRTIQRANGRLSGIKFKGYEVI